MVFKLIELGVIYIKSSWFYIFIHTEITETLISLSEDSFYKSRFTLPCPSHANPGSDDV